MFAFVQRVCELVHSITFELSVGHEQWVTPIIVECVCVDDSQRYELRNVYRVCLFDVLMASQ